MNAKSQNTVNMLRGASQMGEVEVIDAMYCIILFIAFFLKTNLFYTINFMFFLSLRYIQFMLVHLIILLHFPYTQPILERVWVIFS